MRSHQLKLGNKLIEERRRRKEEEGEEGIQSRKPSGAGTQQPNSRGSGEHIEKEGGGGP